MHQYSENEAGGTASGTPHASGSASGYQSAILAKKYTRDIITNLVNGIIPVFNPELAGEFAPVITLLLEDYDTNDIPSFNASLDAVKIKYPEVRRLVEVEEEKIDPDFTVTTSGKTIFKTLSITDILAQPDIEWLVSGILQRHTTTLVVGTGNVGKTFVWLDVCFDIACGERWLNRRTQKGRVLYIYAEGRGGLKQRVQAILKERGKLAEDGSLLEPIDSITFIPRPVQLLSERQLLIDTIEALPELPEEVVIDTFSMCASGVEENSNSQVAQYLETATHIKLRYGCHVTIIHHCNKSGGFRGASALRDNVDTMIGLEREDETGPINMTAMKQRDGGYFQPLQMWLKVIDLGTNPFTGDAITSCVVTTNPDEAVNASEKGTILPERQQKMIELLVTHGELTSSKWEKECFDAFQLPKSSFLKYAGDLVEVGLVEKVERVVGKQKRVFYSLPTKAASYNQPEMEEVA